VTCAARLASSALTFAWVRAHSSSAGFMSALIAMVHLGEAQDHVGIVFARSAENISLARTWAPAKSTASPRSLTSGSPATLPSCDPTGGEVPWRGSKDGH
jgi:hypothetical protein